MSTGKPLEEEYSTFSHKLHNLRSCVPPRTGRGPLPVMSDEQRGESQSMRDQRDERNLKLLSELSMKLPRPVIFSSIRQVNNQSNTKVKSSPPCGHSNVSPDIMYHFPSILYAVLSTPEYEPFVAWLPHGRAWKILCYEVFILKILPIILGVHHGGFRMFERKLTTWGFRAVTHGPDTGAYFHEFFLRDLPRVHLVMRPTETALACQQLFNTSFSNVVDLSARASSERFRTSFDYVKSNQTTRPEAFFRNVVYEPCPLDSKNLDHLKQSDSMCAGSKSFSWAETIANDLAVAQDLHDRTVERLEIAKTVVDQSLATDKTSETQLKAEVMAPCQAISRNSPKDNNKLRHAVYRANSSCKQSPLRSPKRTRRKWLPSFGVSPTFNPALLRNIPYLEDTSGDWVYTSPEAFATLSENRALKRQQLSSPKDP